MQVHYHYFQYNGPMCNIRAGWRGALKMAAMDRKFNISVSKMFNIVSMSTNCNFELH